MGLKKKSKVSAEFSMSSLTDIIFLLLIFFMLTSTLVSPNALRLTLPSSSSKTVAPQSYTVSIKNNGTYYLNGKEMSLGNIESQLRVDLQNSTEKKPTVVIAADQASQLQYTVKVMDLANRLGTQAIIATEPSK
ncbi:ExbD/TolR family protein [Membranihabitans maritimus]|uniref:ExbD/TolR family protein n=1 Tax=Membranihabitans maritimus TaxID=2904244 RepID=UPI001F219A1A|nr:biopolymer transporter ExbD [Membranihabitans maritimus]